MTIKLRFFKQAMYIGAFYSERFKVLYVHPLPFVGFEIDFKSEEDKRKIRASQERMAHLALLDYMGVIDGHRL